MTKEEFEKINYLLKENLKYTSIIEALRHCRTNQIISRFSDGSIMNNHTLTENETNSIIKIFEEAKALVVLKLKELGYDD